MINRIDPKAFGVYTPSNFDTIICLKLNEIIEVINRLTQEEDRVIAMSKNIRPYDANTANRAIRNARKTK